jgi:Mg-chelatase subunit ChlD
MFQRLQLDPLLLLQLLALLLLAAALARPTLLLQGRGAERLIFVMDTSASMKARDVGSSRIREAQQQAASLIAEAGQGAEMMVIEAGSQPTIRLTFTRDRDRARRAVFDIEARDQPNHLSEAIRTALALVPRRPRVRIRDDRRRSICGAGRGSVLGSAGSRSVAAPQCRHHAVRRPEGLLRGVRYQAFLSVTNFSDERVSFPCHDDRRPQLSEQTIRARPPGEAERRHPYPRGGGVVKAVADVRDDLARTAWSSGGAGPRKLRVLLVSQGNLFLEKALRTDPQVVLETKTPGEYSGGMGTFDVVVLDGTSPAKIGAGRFVLVNSTPGDVPIESLGTMEQPVVLDWVRTHPVMRFVDLSKVAVEEALRVRPLAAGKTLLESVGGPLIFLLEEPQRKAVFVGFDLFKTDLPLRVAFPLIWRTASVTGGPRGSDLMVTAGRRSSGRRARRQETVRDPTGSTQRAQIAGRPVVHQTDRVGYRTTTGGSERSASRSTSWTSTESNIGPCCRRAAPDRGRGRGFTYQRELWPYLLGLAIVTLAFEGFLYWQPDRRAPTWPLRSSDRWALLSRGVALLQLVWAFTQPQFTRWLDRQNVFFVMDMSDSVSLAARETAYRWTTAALGGMKAGDRAGLITFGADPQLAEPLRPAPTFARPQPPAVGRATNIARAIQLAQASLPRGEANRIVLLSDGRENAGKAVMAAQTAKDAGIPIYYSPVGLTFPQEVVVEQLLLPNEVKFGEPFYAKVVVNAVKEASGRLSLYRNGEFLGSQVVPERREERPDVPPVARAGGGPRLPGARGSRGRRHRGEQPSDRHHGRARQAAGAPGRQGGGDGPEPGQRPPLPVLRSEAGRSRGAALDDGRSREV